MTRHGRLAFVRYRPYASAVNRFAFSTVLLLTAWPPGRLSAQCPDGAPPPCRVAAPAAARPAPDTNHIAILPFRVTTADSMLGEGLAELLANEFTGESGPRAVHMGSVLRAWRRAGGGLRAPLSQPDEIRVAAEVGAGLVVDGSVVGLGSRLTLSASIVRSDGSVRRVQPVSASQDSLPALVERLAAGLLAAAGTSRAGPPPRLSDSPDAIRAYIEALSYFRRGKFPAAAVAFERAFAADTLFARAAFMRWLTATWGPGFGAVANQWRDRAESLKGRLSGPDQVLLDAAFGDLAAKERAAQVLPESPEVHYFIGDNYYHSARARGWDAGIARARAEFERSLALDSQATSLQHLLEIGLWTSDTSLLRTVWPAYEHMVSGGDLGMGQLVATRLGDRRMLEAQRRRSLHAASDTVPLFVVWGGPLVGMPASQLDEAFAQLLAAQPAADRTGTRELYAQSLFIQGRPAAAAAMLAEIPPADTSSTRLRGDIWTVVTAAMGDGDRRPADAALARLRQAAPSDSVALAQVHCATALWDALVRDTLIHDAVLEGRQRSCGTLIDLLAAQKAGQLDSTGLARFDSVIVARSVLWTYSSVGPVLLSRAWESIGVKSRALARMRGGSVGFPDDLMTVRRRAEGRLAAMTGDTTGAIRAYREYLELRRNAEPVLIPQRDSVQAALNLLLHRATP